MASSKEYVCPICRRIIPTADAKPHGEYYIEKYKLVCSQGHVCYVPRCKGNDECQLHRS